MVITLLKVSLVHVDTSGLARDGKEQRIIGIRDQRLIDGTGLEQLRVVPVRSDDVGCDGLAPAREHGVGDSDSIGDVEAHPDNMESVVGCDIGQSGGQRRVRGVRSDDGAGTRRPPWTCAGCRFRKAKGRSSFERRRGR